MADHQSGESTPRPAEASQTGQKQKRSLFGFGKKKTSDSAQAGLEPSTNTPSLPQDNSKMSTTSTPTISHSQADPALAAPASPPRALSGSPRIVSPAGSQIFERDVQESGVLPPTSPAIPTHIQTENHIPPVLDEASEAITNSQLDPDAVEIVTHSSHQPASLAVTAGSPPGGATPHESFQPSSEWADELSSFSSRQLASPPDSASNYGSLDSTDVRRLSFISFADVVQSEHGLGGPGSRESIHMTGLTSIPAGLNRSPSPIRSPVSSQGPGISPPTSNPGSVKGVELSPSRKPFASPHVGGLQPSLSPSSELNIETMSQALRRTGSTDLSYVRSMPISPVEGPGSG